MASKKRSLPTQKAPLKKAAAVKRSVASVRKVVSKAAVKKDAAPVKKGAPKTAVKRPETPAKAAGRKASAKAVVKRSAASGKQSVAVKKTASKAGAQKAVVKKAAKSVVKNGATSTRKVGVKAAVKKNTANTSKGISPHTTGIRKAAHRHRIFPDATNALHEQTSAPVIQTPQQTPPDNNGQVMPQSTPPKGVFKPNNVSVRMYCHGFGDCFLLTFRDDDQPVFRMLIDCGMLTGDTSTLKQAIAHIKAECGGRLDLVVQTHEHKDHISGFNLRDDDKKLLWDDIVVDKVWLAWTENTSQDGNDLAIQLKLKQEKKKKALAKALHLYNQSIQQDEHRAMLNNEYRGSDYYAAQQRYATALQQMLEFYDIDEAAVAGMGARGGTALGLTMKDAMGYFVQRSAQENGPDVSFWAPGDMADTKKTGLTGVNFYFLGPPQDYDKLRVMDDSSHAEMYLTEMGLSDNFFMALTEDSPSDKQDALSPFHKRFAWQEKEVSVAQRADKDHVLNLYQDKANNWRSIETDWLHNAGALALNLDSYTNNTSLVIAIELEESGKVLLFPADAQIGNWLSWTETDKDGKPVLQWPVVRKGKQETITTTSLLERTVLYKVGHHASHNATARAHGLELMTSEELVAMIPVDEEVAKKQGKKGWKMPAEDLYKRLREKTRSRIIRLDTGSLLANGTTGLAEGTKPTKDQLAAFNQAFSESNIIITTGEGRKRPLFVEYLIRG